MRQLRPKLIRSSTRLLGSISWSLRRRRVDSFWRGQSTNDRLVEAIEKLGQKASTVDSKGVGKPFTFSSDEARFAAWQKKLRNYDAAALPGARVFMDWAGEQGSSPIARAQLEEQFSEQLPC